MFILRMIPPRRRSILDASRTFGIFLKDDDASRYIRFEDSLPISLLLEVQITRLRRNAGIFSSE